MPLFLAFLWCETFRFDGGGVFTVFLVVEGREVLWQNSPQSSPLSRMKLVISRKASYVTTACFRGMVRIVVER